MGGKQLSAIQIEFFKRAFVGIVFFRQKPGVSLVDNPAHSGSMDSDFSLSLLILGFKRR